MMAVKIFILLVLTFVLGVTGNEVVIGILGNSVSLECGLPLSDTLIWEDSDGIVLAMHGTVASSFHHKYVIERQNNIHEILIIHDISLTDEKMYKCYDLVNKSAFEISNVTVLVKPPVMKLSYPTEAVMEGTEVTLICEADGSKPLPVITWHKIGPDNVSAEVLGFSKDVMYSNGTGYRRSVLTVNVTRDTYMMSYVCDISVTVFYHNSMVADLDVQLKPLQPVISGYVGAYDAGKELSLECTSTGSNPAGTIFWLLDNVRVGNYEFEVIPEGDELYTVKSYFRRIMPPHLNASVLTCAVTNTVMEKQGLPPLLANISLLESFKPRLLVANSNYTGTEGGNVTLNCRIEARPDPDPSSLMWYKDNLILDKTLHRMSQTSGVFQLHMTNISRADTGYYTCGASNRMGVSYSAAISLSVLYVPECRSGSIEKHAARLGDRIRLNCHMDAFPTEVTMQWLYPDTGLIIKTNKTSVDSHVGYPRGNLDLVVNSYSLNKMIYCYASNLVGQGHTPCKYQIVEQSAPDPPINCSGSATGSSVEVICKAGFNGGSTQTFMLHQLIESGYQSVSNNSLPVFQVISSKNTTLLVCSVNEEFNNVKRCAEPVNIVILQADVQSSQTVRAKKTNTSAFIAGGVTAAIGILIISLIVIIVCRRRKPSSSTTLPTSLRDLEPALKPTSKNQDNPASWPKSLWQKIMSMRFTKNKKEANKSTHSLRRGKIVTRQGDSDDDDVTYQTIEVIASTPHFPSKQHRLNMNESNTSFLKQFVGDYRPKTDQDGNLMILNATTGISLSPISIHSENSRLANMDQEYTTRDDHTDAMTGVAGEAYRTTDIRDILGDRTEEVTGVTGVAYKTADIRDVLGDQTNKLQFTNEHTVNDGFVTRLKDYSAGDILEVLDSSAINSNLHEQSSVRKTLPSYDESMASIQRFPFRHGNITCDFSKNNMYSEEPTFNMSTQVRCINDTKRELFKAYSLPYRTKTKTNPVAKIKSETNLYTNACKQVSLTRKGLPTGQNQASLGPETIRHISQIDHINQTRTSLVSNSTSVLTDVDVAPHDIDEYTLSAGSVSSSEYNGVDGAEVSDDDPSAYICVMGGHSIENSSASCDSKYNSGLRRNSFLSAINNDQCFHIGDDSEYMLPSLFNAFEHTYVNEGLDLDESVENKCSSDDLCRSSSQSSDNRTVNVVAYF